MSGIESGGGNLIQKAIRELGDLVEDLNDGPWGATVDPQVGIENVIKFTLRAALEERATLREAISFALAAIEVQHPERCPPACCLCAVVARLREALAPKPAGTPQARGST